MDKATVLLDSNILINFEDPSHALSKESAEILKIAHSYVRLFYHPLQIEELNKYKNEIDREKTISRIRQFEELQSPPIATEDNFLQLGWSCKKENDRYDNQLLWCLREKVVSFFVTEDRRLIKKAKRSGLAERVFTLTEFGDWLDGFNDKPIYDLTIQNRKCHTINIDDPFFDSLKDAYGEIAFEKWWNKKCRMGQRDCWALISDEGHLNGICVYKEENSEQITIDGYTPSGKILKLCTFKIAESAIGAKEGEKLLKAAFNYSVKNNYDFIYFHVDEKRHPHLVDLVCQFGFERVGKHISNPNDAVYGKCLKPVTNQEGESLSKSDYIQKFFPLYKKSGDVNYFIVPIKRQWHERLFPDVSDLSNSLLRDNPEMYSAESNAIRKTYICKSYNKSLEPGDIMLFYRSKDRMSIQSVGVVREAYRSDDVNEIFYLSKRRTVYSRDEIEMMLKSSKSGKLSVIVFDHVENLASPLSLEEMKKLGINSVPRKLSRISEEIAHQIMTLCPHEAGDRR